MPLRPVPSSSLRRPRARGRTLQVLTAVALAASPLTATAAEELAAPPEAPVPVPPMPEPADVELSPDEWQRVQAGEIVVQIVEYSPDDRQARAIGYLDSPPNAIFDVATDSKIAMERFDEIDETEVYERYPHAKRFRVVVDPAWYLPSFEFVSFAVYHPARMAQVFRQVEGDFDRNEGTHVYFWDPERQRTLAVVTFAFGLKGILSIVPESFILQMASRNLPAAVRRLDAIAQELATTDPERHRRLQQEWAALRPRLETGAFPGLVWRGPVAVARTGSEPARP